MYRKTLQGTVPVCLFCAVYMERYININGKIQPLPAALIAAGNKAFRYGYGLFETMLFRENEIGLKELHWQRLFSGMRQLHFDISTLFTREYLEREIANTVRKNKLEAFCRVRLQIFAGSGGLYENTYPKPEFVIECFPLDAHTLQLNETGLATGIATGLYKSIDTLSNIKSSNALIYAVAAQQAKANKWNDALIQNTQGHVIESTIANIFWTKNDIVYTPPISQGCIAGVMRSYLIQQLQEQGFTLIEQALTADILWSADSVFLTNAIRRMKWVYSVDDHVFSNKFINHIYNSVFQPI